MSTNHATDQIGYDPHRTATLSQRDEHLRDSRRLADARLKTAARGHLILAEWWPNGTVDEQYRHVKPKAVAETIRNVHAEFVRALTAIEMLVPAGRERSIAVTALEDAHTRALRAIVMETDIAKQPLADFVRAQDRQLERDVDVSAAIGAEA